MTGSNRKLGLLLVLSLVAAPSALAQDAVSTFNQAVDMLQRDRKAEALALLQQLAAMELTPDQAIELWNSTSGDVWLDLMAEGGQFEIAARRLQLLVSEAKRTRRNDPAAIQELIGKLASDDAVARLRVVRQLSADHGEYAVPYLLPSLGDSGNEERRITMMQTLAELSVDAVQPLIAGLASEDAFMRRNIATVLGTIGDGRAAGALEGLAASDPDSGAQIAAREALARVKGTGSACKTLSQLGELYHLRSSDVLPDYAYSAVVWHWEGQNVVGKPVPRALYADELAKGAFMLALHLDSACADAHAGLARATASQLATAEALTLGGADVAELAPYVENGSIKLNLAGPAAADAALSRAVAQNDAGAAVMLIRALGNNAAQPTAGLTAALRSGDGAIRSEAAVACGRMSAAGKGKCPPEVLGELGEIAGREVVRVAVVIDGDSARANAAANALRAAGIMPSVANSGALGLSMLLRMPGADAILIGDQLPDVTPSQVLEHVRDDPTFAKTPVMLLSSVENAAEPYGDRIQGVLADANDVSAVKGALDANMGTDRARADALSVQAAEVLASLAGSNDIRSACAGLGRTLANRSDAVVVPASRALAVAGGAEQLGALVAVAVDGNRSEAARAAAANAAAAILGRGASAPAEVVTSLHELSRSDAPLTVRQAAGAALGNLNLSHSERAAHLLEHGHAQG